MESIENNYCVSELDRYLLNNEHCELDDSYQDKLWLTRHLPGEDGFRFSCYYIKMKKLLEESSPIEFARRYGEHAGSPRNPQKIVRWIYHLMKLEKELNLAIENMDSKRIYEIKMEKHEFEKIKNIPCF